MRRLWIRMIALSVLGMACSENPLRPPRDETWPHCPGLNSNEVHRDVVWDISPDNRHVLYVHIKPGEPTGALYMREITPDAVARFLMPAAILDPWALRFSRDGKRIAMVRKGTFDIYVLDLETGELKRLTFTGGNAKAPEWDPTGRYVLYMRPFQAYDLPDTASGFHIVDTVTLESMPFRQADGSWIGGGEPRWSPDGRWITFWLGTAVDPGPRPRTAKHLYRIASDGSGLRDLTPGLRNNESPFWIHGGKEILYLSFPEGTYNEHTHHVVDFDGTRIREWPVDLSPYGTKLVISRDGTLFAAAGPDSTCERKVIYIQEIMDLQGATRIKLVHQETGPPPWE